MCCVLGARYLWTRGNSLYPAAEPYAKGIREGNNVDSDDAYERKIKTKILAASLKYVNEFGWSQRAITAGAESIGYPGVIHGMFPNAGAELVHHFQAVCNARLVEILRNEVVRAVAEGQSKRSPSPMRQVQNAIERRLRMVIPHKTNWPQALALVSLPPNLPTSIANLSGLVDDICYYTGDRSVDFNWYTRRATIAAIYKSTELYLLRDDSEDHKRTWEFLERRIDQVPRIHRISSSVSDPAGTANALVNVVGAILRTTSNMLGINGGHR